MKQQTVAAVERERERVTLYRINENKNFAKLVIKNIASIFSEIKYINVYNTINSLANSKAIYKQLNKKGWIIL